MYVSFLNLEGRDKRGVVLLRKRLKGQDLKGYIREVEVQNDAQTIEEIKAAGAAAV